MGPENLFLNNSIKYCPKLMKFDSGTDNGNLYQILKTDPDLIQKADFIAISIKTLRLFNFNILTLETNIA